MKLQEIADSFAESLATDSRLRARVPRISKAAIARQPEVGDVWMTRGAPSDLPFAVAITWVDRGACRGVLVLEEAELASSDDVIVNAELSPLGVAIALCLWRDVPISTKSLDVFLGTLSDDILEPMAMLLQQRLTGGFHKIPVGPAQLSTGEPAARWTISAEDGAKAVCAYVTGTPIMRAGDPRLNVRDVLAKYSAYVEIAALMDEPEERRSPRERGVVVQWRAARPQTEHGDIALVAQNGIVKAWPFRVELAKGGERIGTLVFEPIVPDLFVKNESDHVLRISWRSRGRRRTLRVSPNTDKRVATLDDIGVVYTSSHGSVSDAFVAISLKIEVVP